MQLPEHPARILWDRAKAFIIILIVYYAVTHFTGCPIRFLTGISCPGCGVTRAWLALLHLNLSAAMTYHPLFWAAPILVFLIFFEPWIDWKRWTPVVVVIVVLYIAVYLYRMISGGDPVVVFEPQNGLFVRIFTSRLFS